MHVGKDEVGLAMAGIKKLLVVTVNPTVVFTGKPDMIVLSAGHSSLLESTTVSSFYSRCFSSLPQDKRAKVWV
ncbi:hypothetical protein HMF8227_00263 [Saliniradius amylolyticus]|uniref:Uncharacterized protein n=1 Tax=Saliniradius amylolyticus TaxID=2183582 RepID=A0A2S2DZF2_9ALTE|nr:hypothetical protein HMF8227_00263 [Saliniradius amylolyticus]